MPKILAIDDKQDNLITISALLRNLIPDSVVLTAGSGKEGIAKAKAELPDTILLDIIMPGMDGFEVCRRLKSDEKTKHIPIIMLTAIKTDSESRVKGLELGADAFLSKPIDKTELAAQVKVMLRIKKIENDLRKEKKALQKAHDELEKKVEERTLELAKSNDELKTLSAISETVNQSLDLDQVLNDALDRIMELFKPHSSHIRLLDNKTQELVLAAHKGLTPEDLKKLRKRLKPEEAISHHAIKSHKVLIIEDILTDPHTTGTEPFAEKIGCRTLVVIPLYGKDKLLGHMSIRDREPSAFAAGEIQLFTSIGHQVGTAIENARLYRDMEVTIKELNETQDKLQQAQKMESIGTLAGGIAHDFNNILSPIMIHSEMAMMELPSGSPLKQNMKQIYKAGERARDLVKQILTFARRQEKEQIPIKISRIVKEAIKLLRSTIPTTIDIIAMT